CNRVYIHKIHIMYLKRHPPTAAVFPYTTHFRSIASVGLTETQAEAQGYQVMVGRFPFAASGRALTTGESEGFVKVVADASSHVVDRKSTRLNSSHVKNTYAVFCLNKNNE